MLGGTLLGGYCLSRGRRWQRPGRDAHPGDDGRGRYRVTGAKAWVTHGGEADFYTLFARTSDDPRRGISCFLAPGEAAGLEPRRRSARWA